MLQVINDISFAKDIYVAIESTIKRAAIVSTVVHRGGHVVVGYEHADYRSCIDRNDVIVKHVHALLSDERFSKATLHFIIENSLGREGEFISSMLTKEFESVPHEITLVRTTKRFIERAQKTLGDISIMHDAYSITNTPVRAITEQLELVGQVGLHFYANLVMAWSMVNAHSITLYSNI